MADHGSHPRIEPVKKSRLSAQVAARLKELIQDGTFAAGDRFPGEQDLADQLQVSRASVREALLSLEMLGYVDSKIGVGGGHYVKERTIETIMDPLREMFPSEKREILAMLEYRLVLETEIARLAASRRSEKDLEAIKASLLLMKSEIDRGDIGLEGDNAFHDALAQATGNVVFEMMLKMAKGLLCKTRETTLRVPGQASRSLKDHWDIYYALVYRKADTAARAMHNHLQKAMANAEIAG